MSTQSLTTPARFMVRALVLPTKRKTQRLRPKAVTLLATMWVVDHVQSSSSWGGVTGVEELSIK